MDRREIQGAIEAILFINGEPLPIADLRETLDITELEMINALEALQALYELDGRGLRLNRFGGSVQLTTNPEYAPYVERLLQPSQKQTLSHAALETLSVIAYRQPVTRAQIEAVRGVKCDYSVQSLTGKGLIQVVGKRETIGHPLLYGTTDEFLRHFGIESLNNLPELIEFTADELVAEPLPQAEDEE